MEFYNESVLSTLSVIRFDIISSHIIFKMKIIRIPFPFEKRPFEINKSQKKLKHDRAKHSIFVTHFSTEGSSSVL